MSNAALATDLDTQVAATETFTDIVRLRAKLGPDQTAFTFGEEVMDFAALDEGSNRAAQALLAMGVKKGDRISYLGKNHHLYFEALVGAAKLGAVMTPVNWRLAPPEVAYILDNCEAEIVIVAEGFAETLAKIRAQTPRIREVIGMDAEASAGLPDYRQWRDAHDPIDPQVAIGANDELLQLYTSGTTGRPKGAVMTHLSILSARTAGGGEPEMELREWQEPIANDVSLVAMPCFHISGTGNGIANIVSGTNSIVLPEYDPSEALELMERYPISKLFLVPAAIQILLNHPRIGEIDFSNLRYITYGASPIPLALMKQAMEVLGCGFIQMYGMTETSGTITALDPDDHVPEGSPKMASVGTALAGIELKVIDKEGNTLAPNEIGEIATRSAKNMKGYWRLDEATAETIDNDGWLRTGDAGCLDEDGYLYIRDRVKDMIISGGENVYPAEVENALYAHDAVADVAVIGVPHEKWGEAVKACVVVKDGASLSEADLIAHAREHIAGYKCPKSIDFITELPRNPSGKILRRELRAPYWEGKDKAVN
ncbi:MAG: fatty acid--CoA ligase [Erythrobacter sp.]